MIIHLNGYGSDHTGFEYLYDVPVKSIEMNFNKTFLFVIKNKVNDNIWFMGKVYVSDEHVDVSEIYNYEI